MQWRQTNKEEMIMKMLDYSKVEIEILTFSSEDVIVTSCGKNVPTNQCREVDFGLPVIPGMPQLP